MASKEFKFAEFEDPNRCSFCREPISEADTKNGLVLHVKVAPRKALNPETGEVMGFLKPDGPANRYLHARPCGESYAQAQLICTSCNYWRMSKQGSGLCICACHPPTSAKTCRFKDKDMERVEDSTNE